MKLPVHVPDDRAAIEQRAAGLTNMLHVVLWKWKQERFREVYTSDYVNITAAALRDNLVGINHRIVCITDDPKGLAPFIHTYPLWDDYRGVPNSSGAHLPSCYRRLKLFDPDTQHTLDIAPGERICSFDVDSLVTGSLTEIFRRIESTNCTYAGWGVKGTFHHRVFNGSFWTFLAGEHAQMWSSFNVHECRHRILRAGYLGSDQAWLSYNFAKHDSALGIGYPEFASYPREVRKLGKFDHRTKVVFFHGSKKQWHADVQRLSPWIKRYWKDVT